ncbi:MAG: hypothetical protein U5R46_06995 [Gammaproteobacteria bacterium]|nr:hypothetical protein [Gammaproteobacteria bacterium]
MSTVTVQSQSSSAGRAPVAIITAAMLTGILALAGPAHAAGPATNHIQGAYADWDDADNGVNIGGSLMIGSTVRGFADYTDTDLEQLRIGGGFLPPSAGPLSFEVGGSYQNLEAGGLDDDGIGVHGIARFAATPEFTLAGKAEYVFRDDIDNEIVLGVDADYRFTQQLSAFVSYDLYDEIDENLLMIGGRLHF